MSTIDDLNIPHLNELSKEQQLKLILDIRARRRVTKTEKPAKINVNKIKGDSSLKSMLKLMSPQELAEFQRMIMEI